MTDEQPGKATSTFTSLEVQAHKDALTHQPSLSPKDLGSRGGGRLHNDAGSAQPWLLQAGGWGVHLPFFHMKEQNLYNLLGIFSPKDYDHSSKPPG